MKPMWKPAALAVALPLAAAIARAQISTGATPVYHGTLKIVRPAVGTLDKSTGIRTLRVRGWRWKLKESSNGIIPTREPLVVALGEDSFRLDAGSLTPSRNRKVFRYSAPPGPARLPLLPDRAARRWQLPGQLHPDRPRSVSARHVQPGV